MWTDRTLSPAPPSMRVLVTRTLLMTGEQSIGRAPTVAAHLIWSDELKVIVLGPPKRARSLELGEGCIHFTGELLEDALGGWGLSATQDAGDGARLLEAPSPSSW